MESARGLPPLRTAVAKCNNEEKACPLDDFCSARACKFASRERGRRHPRRTPRPLTVGRPAPQIERACPFQPGTGRSRARPRVAAIREEKKRLWEKIKREWRTPQIGAYPRAAAMGAPATPLPLHSLPSPLVTDRVMKHAHTRQDCWRRCAKGAGERARHVRGGQPCFASSL
jgi:hypothetical protein